MTEKHNNNNIYYILTFKQLNFSGQGREVLLRELPGGRCPPPYDSSGSTAVCKKEAEEEAGSPRPAA